MTANKLAEPGRRATGVFMIECVELSTMELVSVVAGSANAQVVEKMSELSLRDARGSLLYMGCGV
jgi:hypothetical protein